MSHSIEDDFEEFFSDQKPAPVGAQAMRLTAETTLDLLAWLPAERYRITDMAGTAALYFLPLTGGAERVWLGDWIVRTDTGGFELYARAQYCPTSRRVDGPTHTWRFDGDDPYIICVFCDEMRDALNGRVIRPAAHCQAVATPPDDTPASPQVDPCVPAAEDASPDTRDNQPLVSGDASSVP